MEIKLKKYGEKNRLRDVFRSIKHRKGLSSHTLTHSNYFTPWKKVNSWVEEQMLNGIDFVVHPNNGLILNLPVRLDFSANYEQTTIYVTAIRKLARRGPFSRKAYKLKSVNFEKLKSISTSAALVLTAELSRWQDNLGKKLVPRTKTWEPKIYSLLASLGFFDLFETTPEKPSSNSVPELNFVRYIKGKASETSKARQLRKSLSEVIGDNIDKWTFLRGGLDEAITNVSHHAYPRSLKLPNRDKNWYLTGSFNSDTSELKIAFYDQGIGIPKSLPASEVWEKIIKFLANVSDSDRKLHKTLLRAAVKLDRTSTEANDRGKGLQDLLTFIQQRGSGYLSIISLKGLYKYTMYEGAEKEKSFSFKNELPGTLIIWSATLKN